MEDQAELNLQKSLNSLEEILLGTKQEDLDLAEENLSKAKSSLDKIKGGSDKNDIAVQRLLVSQADDNISKTKLYASFDGQISSINSKVGEFIGSGQNLMTLTDPETIEMEIIASEAEYVEMEEGMYGIVALDSKPESPLIIQVVSISDVPNVQQGVVTYPVRARFIRGFEVISLIDKFRPLIQSLIGGIDPSSLQNIPGGGFPCGGSFPWSGMGGRPKSNQNFDMYHSVMSTGDATSGGRFQIDHSGQEELRFMGALKVDLEEEWMFFTYTKSTGTIDTSDNQKVRVYLDGEFNGYAYPISTLWDKLKIGMNRLGGGGWYGLIDDVRIYNRALTEDEIVELYESYEWK